MNWNEWFFDMCKVVAKKSKDPSTQVGCVIVDKDNIVVSVGYNGFARGVEDNTERLNDRSLKYPLTVHSELNAICAAARKGVSLKGCTIYLTWFPCVGCANAIVQAGITEVYVMNYNVDTVAKYPEWRFDLTWQVFNESKTKVILPD